jgi:c-di-GMP-binding flagellar brake protein YcgR
MSIFNFLQKSFKRIAQRKKVKIQVKLTQIKVTNQKNWTHSEYLGTSLDLSPKGIRISTHAPIEAKDVVQLRFSLSNVSKSIEIQASAKSIQVDEKGKRTIGLEFINSNPEIQKYLSTILLLYRA